MQCHLAFFFLRRWCMYLPWKRFVLECQMVSHVVNHHYGMTSRWKGAACGADSAVTTEPKSDNIAHSSYQQSLGTSPHASVSAVATLPRGTKQGGGCWRRVWVPLAIWWQCKVVTTVRPLSWPQLLECKHMTVRNLCYEHDKVITYCKAEREITTGKDFLSFCWFLFPMLSLS